MKYYLLASLLLLAACQSAGNQKQAAAAVAAVVTPTKSAAEAEKPTISLQVYQQLKIGMTREEVETIMGAPGKELIASQKGSTKTVFYEWTAGESSSVRLMFQNDRLMDMSQHGLQ